jgi:LmbE family N-acetylglucosaminyl deacetylase
MSRLSECKRVLTFFAHPDDETLAAGATIAKMTRLGSEVHVAIPATGINSRRNMQDEKERNADLISLREDCEKALAILGVPSHRIYLGDFPDNEMDKHSLLETIHWLEVIIKQVQPELVLTHHRFCTNIDHRFCHEAVVVATRPSLQNHVTVLCGEVPSSTGYLKPSQSKVRAMEAYTGESRPDPHPRSREVLKALAKVRGSESGFYYSESFMIQKVFG